MMHEKFCMISDRPRVLKIDDDNRPHCEDGPSHVWSGGMMLWYWHGVKVDRQIIEQPQTQTIEQIKGEQNAEVKRVRIERFGWESYLKAVKAKVVDSRRNDVECTREALMQTDDGMAVLVCHCPSTARIYAMEVAPQVRTCEAAQNYLWSGSGLVADQKRLNLIGRS